MTWDEYQNLPSGTKFQTGLGIGQLAAGAFIPKGTRPQYSIPSGVQEATSIARSQANATVRPGNEYAVSQIKGAEGRGITALQRSLGSASEILAGTQGINQNTQKALNENANQNTVFKFNATRNLQDSLARLGQYQEKQWYENQYKPYMDRVQTKNMLTGAGLQNLGSAANTATELSFYDKVFGNNQSAGWDEEKDFMNRVDNYQPPNAYKMGFGNFRYGNMGLNSNWPSRSWGKQYYQSPQWWNQSQWPQVQGFQGSFSDN